MTLLLEIEIFPAGVRAAIGFYTNVLGLTLVQHEPDMVADADDSSGGCIDKGYARFVKGLIHVGAHGSHPANSLSVGGEFRHHPTTIELGFEIRNWQSARDSVREQRWPARLDEEIKLQPWGLRDFRLEEPDEHYVGVSEKRTKGDGTGS